MVIGYSLPERFVFKGTEWFDRIGFKNGFFQGQGLVFIELLKLLILDSWFHRIGSTSFWTVGFGPPKADQDTGSGLDLDLVWFSEYRISINF
jgi:hypothetical protein